MTETLRYGLLGASDIRFGSGVFEVRLADGRVVTIPAVNLSHISGALHDGITVLQSGTGAVARSAKAKLGDLISGEDFALPTDGVTLASTAIQRAINEAVARGGGTVWIRPNAAGNPYLLNQVGANPYLAGHRYCLDIPGDHVRLVLDEGVTLKLADGQQVDATGPVDLIVMRSRSRITITGGGRITGNTAGQTGWTGGYAQENKGTIIAAWLGTGGCRDITIEGLQLDDHFSNPVDIANIDSGSGGGVRHARIRLRDLYGFNCGEGFQVSGADDVWMTNLQYEDPGNVAVGDGIELAAVDRFDIRGCRVRTNGAGSAFDLFGARDGTLTDFIVDGWNAGLDINDDTLGVAPRNIVVSHGVIRNPPNGGVLFKGPTFDHVRVAHVIVRASGNQGFRIADDDFAAAGPLTLDGCEASGCASHGVLIKTIKNLTIRGGMFRGNGAAGIAWQGQANAVTAADTAHLHIVGVTATGNVTQGLALFDSATTGKEPTGSITDCVLLGNTAGPLSVNGVVAKNLEMRNLTPSTKTGSVSQVVTGVEFWDGGTGNIATLPSPSLDQRVVVRFAGAVTVFDRTQPSGDNINLNGAVNFAATANDFLVLQYVSSVGQWFEVARSVLP